MSIDREPALLAMLLNLSPGLVVALIGIIVALVLRRRAPAAARLVLIACIVQLGLEVFDGWLFDGWLPEARVAGSIPYARLELIAGVLSMCSHLLHAVPTGLLIWAASAGRSRGRMPPPLR
jgi:hypothetical protein